MAQPWKQTLEDGTEVYRTCAWSAPGCHPTTCGLRVYVKDGKLVKVDGDPEHPINKGRLCVRCLSMKDYIYHPDRIIYPMKRDRADRGKADAWEQCTWDEAYDIIEENWRKITAVYGEETCATFFGTGREGHKYGRVDAFGVLGSPNAAYTQSGWSCYVPRYAVNSFVMGGGYPEIDYGGDSPLLYDDPDYVLPEYVVIWGKEPLKSNPDGFYGHVIIDLMKRGTKLISIDPRMTWIGSRAEQVVKLKPGTDAALALAVLNVIINENLYDHDFVDCWCYGFEELAERVQEYPPEKCAEICDVPVEQIYWLGRTLGTAKPWGLSWGLAVDQNTNGVQAGQAILSIVAITGNLDVPGGTVLGVPQDLAGDSFSFLREKALTPEKAAKMIGADKYPAYPLTVTTAQPDELIKAMETEEPYGIHFVWIQASNLLAPTNSAEPMRWHDVLAKVDFGFATDLFMTPTIQCCCDVFLPINTTIEHDSHVETLYGNNMGVMGAQNKIISVGDTRSDLRITLDLGKRLHPDLFKDFGDEIDFHNEKLAPFGLDFEKLREIVAWQPGKLRYRKYASGMLRRDHQPGFPTTTGRVELYSYMFEYLGEDPLPYYQDPLFYDKQRDEYPLILSTGARDWASFHSEHRQIGKLREITPDPIVEINPEDAEKYGVADGDWVIIENMFGKARERARVQPTVRPGVVMAAHGWWYPEQNGNEPNLFGVWESNINSLIPNGYEGKMGFGSPYKSMICKIYKAQE